MSSLNAKYTPPHWLLFLRIAQSVTSMVVLGLTAFVFTDFTGGATAAGGTVGQFFPGLPFAFFTFAWTFVYLIFARFFAQRLSASAKPILIVLIFESLTLVWWLITFALLADGAAKAAQALTFVDSIYDDVPDAVTVPVQCFEASAGVAALNFLLFIVSLVVVAILTHRNMHSGASVQPTSTNQHDHSKEVQPGVMEISPNTA